MDNMYRLAGVPRELQEEFDRLLHEWEVLDEDIEAENYFDEHASEKMKAYMAEMDGAEEEEMYRIEGVPRELQEEYGRLLREREALDEYIDVKQYFREHGSDKMKAYLEERDRVEDEEM